MSVRRVDDVLVHLVGDDESIVFAGEFAGESQFLLREDLAAGVRRIADDNGPRFLGESTAQFVTVKAETGRVQRHVTRVLSNLY